MKNLGSVPLLAILTVLLTVLLAVLSKPPLCNILDAELFIFSY